MISPDFRRAHIDLCARTIRAQFGSKKLNYFCDFKYRLIDDGLTVTAPSDRLTFSFIHSLISWCRSNSSRRSTSSDRLASAFLISIIFLVSFCDSIEPITFSLGLFGKQAMRGARESATSLHRTPRGGPPISVKSLQISPIGSTIPAMSEPDLPGDGIPIT